MSRKRSSAKIASLAPNIQIQLDPNRKVTVLRLQQRRPREFAEEIWDEDQAIKRFLWYLSRRDTEGLNAATEALIGLNFLSEAFRRCLIGHRPNSKKVRALLQLWNNRGFYALPRALKDDLHLITDAVRYFSPSYAGDRITLYRGESYTRHKSGVYGIAWTSSYKIAEQFSRIRNTCGIVVKVDASSELIVVHVPDHISTPKTDAANVEEYEDEYLLDPRLLVGKVCVA